MQRKTRRQILKRRVDIWGHTGQNGCKIEEREIKMARMVNIGSQDFKDIRENNDFYIDKTDFIREWWENRDNVTLITRPRRFGKTLTMSMTESFFSISNHGRGELFEGLSIWEKEKYRNLQGTYPVIFLSFANAKGNDYQSVRQKIYELIVKLYARNSFLKDSGFMDDLDKQLFGRISMDMDESAATSAVNNMAEFMGRHYNKKVIILLDEYDTPMQEAYINGYWDEMAAFMRNLFNATFKTNPWLERALMTGVTRVSKESIFSDMNNLEVVTATSEKYQTVFGFTESEVFCALKEFGLQAEEQKVKEWYDGFRFGDCDNIYNPWSVVNFLDKKKYSAYWANTSANTLVDKLVREGGPEIKTAMEDLLQGKELCASFDEEIVFGQLGRDPGAIWSLLLAGGYLKIVSSSLTEWGEPTYRLAITNKEAKLVFRKIFTGWFADTHTKAAYNGFIKALSGNDLKNMNAFMNKVALHTFSYFDTGKKPSESAEPERFYHGFVLGLIVELQDRYEITSNRESGFGRYDVMLAPKNKTDDGIILEFKVIDKEEEGSLQDTVNAAIGQILDREYAAALESRGVPRKNIRVYGFAFEGRKVLIGGGYLDSCGNGVS